MNHGTKQRLAYQIGTLRSLRVLLPLISCAMPVTARTVRDGHPKTPQQNETPAIIAVVENEAEVPRKTLDDARSEAARILSIARISIVWEKSAPAKERSEAGPRFLQQENVRIHLHIIPPSMTVGLESSASGLGNSILPESGRGDIAHIFYGHVEALARRSEMPIGTILGYAMAHELGHLLLNSGEHSRTGIMQGEWRREHITLISLGWLLFTEEQATQMRHNIAVWASEQATSGLRSSNADPSFDRARQ